MHGSSAKKNIELKKRLPGRTWLAIVIVILLIPVAVVVGAVYFRESSYYAVSVLIIVLAMVPFVLAFEGRKPQAREVVVIAVMVAIAVAGRAAFFMVPQFKPVVAIVIIAGASLGAERGFIVGALSGFISNFIFGQGPWTPWQMFAFGLIGYLAGLLFSRVQTPKSRIALCVFGFASVMLIYGPLLDFSSVLMFTGGLTTATVIATLAAGVSFNIVHALGTATFLLILAVPICEKLDRLKGKYGIAE